MQIKLKRVSIRELCNGYKDKGDEEGVVAYGGKLDVRPPYQREFVYKPKQQSAVIDTVTKDFPLGDMYWAVRPDGTYEVIDGQQRTLSICQYLTNEFAFEGANLMYFSGLPQDRQDQILDYALTVYLCSGTFSETLDWFRTINIRGEKLTDQELRNAVYTGPWVTDAKRYFSRTGCAAYQLGLAYVKGIPIRQAYLETAIDWISGGQIEAHMAEHQLDANAEPLWQYYQAVIAWVSATFTTKRKLMPGVPWGLLYNEHKDTVLDPQAIEAETVRLIIDDDVTKKNGIYEYILTRDERHLSIRPFSEAIRHLVYERQKGVCPHCDTHFEIDEMEADHVTPWSAGGKTVEANCQMLCKEDNRRKADK